jgi:hypothetical protein
MMRGDAKTLLPDCVVRADVIALLQSDPERAGPVFDDQAYGLISF